MTLMRGPGLLAGHGRRKLAGGPGVRAVGGNAPVEGFGLSGAGERSREPKGKEGVRWAARLGCWRGRELG